jgi:hypothetical protein
MIRGGMFFWEESKGKFFCTALYGPYFREDIPMIV